MISSCHIGIAGEATKGSDSVGRNLLFADNFAHPTANSPVV